MVGQLTFQIISNSELNMKAFWLPELSIAIHSEDVCTAGGTQIELVQHW